METVTVGAGCASTLPTGRAEVTLTKADLKTDLKKDIITYAAPRGRFETVTIAPQQFLMIDGEGDPNTSVAYREALETIYPVAFALKFHSKKVLGRDYTVMPLEALWSANDMEAFTTARDKTRWKWTAMNLVPAWLGPDDVEMACEAAAAKGAPAVAKLRLAPLDEGLAVQTLHVGSYDDEGPVLAVLHDEYLPSQGLIPTGRHHEIYLSDARRTPPEKLRTILRQPVARIR